VICSVSNLPLGEEKTAAFSLSGRWSIHSSHVWELSTKTNSDSLIIMLFLKNTFSSLW
jgi:hypothetical protein